MSRPSPLRRPTLLVILDGFGINPDAENNGIALANTPNLDAYFNNYSHTQLEASGSAVGLPEGQMGNSEVGHLTLGTGTILRQDLVRIDEAIADGSFYSNPVFVEAIETAKRNKRPLHLIGLVSDGGIHSHIRHLYALIDLCGMHGVRPLLHVITDGRDTPPQHVSQYLDELEAKLTAANGGVATVCGRYFAMDRDKRWDRIEASWAAIVFNQGRKAASLRQAVEYAYSHNETDEFIKPTVLPDAVPLEPDNAMIFFNFRKDRTRQLTAALSKDDFNEFDRRQFVPIKVRCMTRYDSYFDLPYAFTEDRPEATLAEIIEQAGLKQFHCAETEKYAHVTYFFNGGRGEAYPHEMRTIIPSPKVSTYDQQPEMSAHEVANTMIEALQSHDYAFLVVNFANGDMVGHTAIHDAVIKAVETLDQEVGRVLEAATTEGYSVILTADHGNCETLIAPGTGAPHTQHTTNLVPCLILDEESWVLTPKGGLKDVAPTVLQLMGLAKPSAMTGHSLLIKPSDSASSKAA